MNKFVKLTSVSDNSPIIIRTSEIVCICEDAGQTEVYSKTLHEGAYWPVKESVEEIWAMLQEPKAPYFQPDVFEYKLSDTWNRPVDSTTLEKR